MLEQLESSSSNGSFRAALLDITVIASKLTWIN